jgi:hypothetical protein
MLRQLLELVVALGTVVGCEQEEKIRRRRRQLPPRDGPRRRPRAKTATPEGDVIATYAGNRLDTAACDEGDGASARAVAAYLQAPDRKRSSSRT